MIANGWGRIVNIGSTAATAGWIDNPVLEAQRRIIQPGEIAAVAAFLCREEALALSMDNIRGTGGAHW